MPFVGSRQGEESNSSTESETSILSVRKRLQQLQHFDNKRKGVFTTKAARQAQAVRQTRMGNDVTESAPILPEHQQRQELVTTTTWNTGGNKIDGCSMSSSSIINTSPEQDLNNSINNNQQQTHKVNQNVAGKFLFFSFLLFYYSFLIFFY